MRPIRRRQVLPNPVSSGPGLDLEPVSLFRPAKGLNYDYDVAVLPPEYASAGSNMVVRKGAWETAPGVGTPLDDGVAVDEVVLAVDFVLSDGSRYLLRLGLTSLHVYNYQTDVWEEAAVTFAGTSTDQFTVTGWADTAVISNGVDQVIRYDPVTNIVTPLVDAPPAKHYTTWAGRLIATHTYEGGIEYPYRIRWSARNDLTKWDEVGDPGAGYEDLFSTPGGYVDGAMGVFPLSDVQAIIVRSQSIWMMQQTGVVQVPFRFSQMFTEVGTVSRHTIRQYMGGIIFAGRDDVYLVGMQGVERIGTPVKDRIFGKMRNPEAAFGVYNWQLRRYRLAVREGAGSDLNTIWDYDFEERTWSKLSLVDVIRSLTFTQFATQSSINDLAGAIDSLGGAINSLGEGPSTFSVLYAFPEFGIGRENPKNFTRPDAVSTYATFIRSGVFRAGSTLELTRLYELVLEIESLVSLAHDVTLAVSWSSDRGNTWSEPLSITSAGGKRRRLLSVRIDEEREDFMLEISGDSEFPFRLLGLVAFVARGARVT